ncbi:putative eka-like protein [Erysiphe necator]|uniref:Putative eka-like protein n=1 Tax=Uncinula necator TaxID=52586 RepID=A0A0B1NVK1_UNCNE|nr:putative eka-like protein [Erysiphe necator]
MEISQESIAISTELSQQRPPIPPIPPAPNPSPPLAPSPPPSLLSPSSNTAASRLILKPVAPSKRQLPERPISHINNNSNIANAFIPQELAEIIATRQRRERAWHARLIICTTVISSLDSSLANFTEEIEIEEAVALKSFLRQAVANFAAADSPPPPPSVPTHTRPHKGNGKGKDKENNITKKVAVATPKVTPSQVSIRASLKEVEQSRTLPSNNNSWATVVCNGRKKARIAHSQDPQVNNKIRGTQKVSVKEKPATTAADKRLFVRLPVEHEWRKLSPAGIREVIVKKLMISPTLIGKIKPVRSEFALTPSRTEARDIILNAGNGLFLSGAKLEPATNWVTVLIPTVPYKIRKQQGEVEISSSLLSDEIERVCSVRPAHVKLYGGNKPEAPHRTWIAFFETAPRNGFRVFNESGIARNFKKPQPLEFCKRCNGHHPAKNCSRAPSCGNCGSTNHSESVCMAASKCKNCVGPHRSDSRRCLARSTRSGAPTKEQMRSYRQAGDREYLAVHRARAAEENADTVNCTNANLTDSQGSENTIITDNIQASPVENSTDDARRL